MIRLYQTMAGARHGGAELFFTRLAPALREAGVEQKLAIRTDADRAAILAAAGLTPLQLRFGGPVDMVTRWKLYQDIRAFQPDIVLAWMNRAASFAPTGDHVLAGRLGGYYDVKYYRRCDHLIGNTPDICRYLRDNGVPDDRVHYLPNFVEETPAQPLDRASLGVPDGAAMILCLGRLHANKAFDVAITALSQLPGAVLCIAGEGPERDALTALAATLGVGDRLRWLGWRDDAAALVATADVLWCPSRHEPLGNVVLEGWAQGVPVVAADSAGPRDLIRSGENGLLVPMEDADALARATSGLLATPALGQTLVGAGRETLAAQFSRAAVVARYVEFFHQVKPACVA